MKALLYNFLTKKFTVKNTPLPKIKGDEVLIKIKISALCGTDLHMIDGPLTEKIYSKKEIILGHSFSGVISKIGNKVKNFKEGDRVFVSNFVWCGKCRRCKEKKENLCDDRYIFGMESPGSHAQYLNVPERALFPLPKDISFEEGSLICDLLALACHSIKKANLLPGQKIIIFGAGPVGLALGTLLKNYGFGSISVAEPVKYRQRLAKKIFNFAIVDGKKTAGGQEEFQNQFDVAFETSGARRAIQAGYRLLKRGGKLVMIGVQNENFNLNALKWVSRELTLLGIFNFDSQDIKKSLGLIRNKEINLSKIITHRFPLAKGAKAYRLLKNRRSGRIVFVI